MFDAVTCRAVAFLAMTFRAMTFRTMTFRVMTFRVPVWWHPGRCFLVRVADATVTATMRRSDRTLRPPDEEGADHV
jgi:hypothetical protein